MTRTIFVGVKSGVQEPLLYLGRRFRQLRKSFASSESDLSETLHF